MPSRKLYDWRCKACDAQFEVLAYGPGDKVTCPSCDSTSTAYVPSGGHFTLNGADLSFPTAAMKWDKRHTAKQLS